MYSYLKAPSILYDIYLFSMPVHYVNFFVIFYGIEKMHFGRNSYVMYFPKNLAK